MSLLLVSALCLLALLDDSLSSKSVQQQIRPNFKPASRIHSGMLTRRGDLPFVMKLEGTKEVSFISKKTTTCSSFLIHPSWILTAAHCKIDQYAFKVHVNSPPETGKKEIDIADADWIIHPLYNVHPGIQNNTADLALIHLANWYINWVTPVTIANFSSDPWTFLKTTQGAMVTNAGYGRTDKFGTLPSQVRKTFMYPETNCPIYACPAFCSPYSGDREPMFCLRGGPGMEGICQGDSGGPILFEDAVSKIAFGIASSVIAAPCSSDDDGPWTEVAWAVRISWHLAWIKEKLCEKGHLLSYMDYWCP